MVIRTILLFTLGTIINAQEAQPTYLRYGFKDDAAYMDFNMEATNAYRTFLHKAPLHINDLVCVVGLYNYNGYISRHDIEDHTTIFYCFKSPRDAMSTIRYWIVDKEQPKEEIFNNIRSGSDLLNLKYPHGECHLNHSSVPYLEDSSKIAQLNRLINERESKMMAKPTFIYTLDESSHGISICFGQQLASAVVFEDYITHNDLLWKIDLVLKKIWDNFHSKARK